MPNIQCSHENIRDAMQFYDHVINILANIVDEEERQKGKQYSHNSFFRDRKMVDKLESEIMK
jgi:hypothetical protein